MVLAVAVLAATQRTKSLVRAALGPNVTFGLAG
jgi:hypothetical protein